MHWSSENIKFVILRCITSMATKTLTMEYPHCHYNYYNDLDYSTCSLTTLLNSHYITMIIYSLSSASRHLQNDFTSKIKLYSHWALSFLIAYTLDVSQVKGILNKWLWHHDIGNQPFKNALNVLRHHCFCTVSLCLIVVFEGTLCSFGEEIPTQNCNIYTTNEVIIQTQKYLFFPITKLTSQNTVWSWKGGRVRQI